MKTLRTLSIYQLLGLMVLIPATAFAISWSMGGFSAPAFFKAAAQAVGVRVTQVCRPNNASYGARGSLHKRCLAMDIGAETPRSKIAALASKGVHCEFHRKGYYKATADHWHCTGGSTGKSRAVARKDQRSKAGSIRAKNKRKVNVRAQDNFSFPFNYNESAAGR